MRPKHLREAVPRSRSRAAASRGTAGEGTDRTAASGAGSGRKARGRMERLRDDEVRGNAAPQKNYLADAKIGGGNLLN